MPDTDRYAWLKDLIKYPFAFLILLLFFGLIIYLLAHIAMSELQWTRAVYLFGGVEAIAFAAAGFLFGKEVHRERADKAEERADKAEVGATEAKERAVAAETKGKTLTAAITGKVKALENKTREYESFGEQPKHPPLKLT